MRRRTRRNPAPRAWKGRSGSYYACGGQRHVPTTIRYRGSKWKVTGCATPRRGKPGVGQYWIARGAQGGGKGHAVPKSVVRSAIYRNKLRNKGRLTLCPNWKTEKVGPKGLTFPHRPGGVQGCTYARGGARGPKPRVTTPRKRGEGYAWATQPPKRPSKSVPWSSAATPTGLPVEHVIANPRVRPGMRVKFSPSPASLALYRDPPTPGATGTVTTIPFPGGRRFSLPGPGGGLVYIDWDDGYMMGVSPIDLVPASSKGTRRNPSRRRTRRGRR